jgi:hypothetical protein
MIAGRSRGPRIGRADVLAADRAAGHVCTPLCRAMGCAVAPLEKAFTAPPRDLDQVAAIAREEAASLARLTQLLGPMRRRIRRSDVERRARLHALHDRALALWYELGALARECNAPKSTGRDAGGEERR